MTGGATEAAAAAPQGSPELEPDGVATGVVERAYRKAGARYFELLVALAGVAILVLVVPAYTALLLPYFHATGTLYLHAVAAFELALGVAVIAMFALAMRRHRCLVRWLGGARGEEAAVKAWESAVGGVAVTVTIMVVWFALMCIAPAVYVGGEAHLAAPGRAVYVVALLLLILGAGAMAYLLLEQALRPVVREISAELPAGFVTRGATPSFAVKLLIILPVINIFTGIVVSAVSTNSLNLEGRLALTCGTTLLVSLTVSLALTLMIRQSLMSRLNELRRAIGRVAGGDYKTRLPYLAGDELDEVGATFNDMVVGLRDREVLHGALGSYVDPSVAKSVLAEGEIVAGREIEVTLLMLDIRGFTSIAERCSPAEVVELLSDFFALVIPIVSAHGGHPNKLIGDGLLAVFGAPTSLEDHPNRAVDAAREILCAVAQRYEGELQVGMGVNSGEVVAGTIGGGGKLDYTLIGDAVNVAARVEQLTKTTGDPVLITESTRRLLVRPAYAIEPRGAHRLRGKAREIAVFAVELPPIPETRTRTVGARR